MLSSPQSDRQIGLYLINIYLFIHFISKSTYVCSVPDKTNVLETLPNDLVMPWNRWPARLTSNRGQRYYIIHYVLIPTRKESHRINQRQHRQFLAKSAEVKQGSVTSTSRVSVKASAGHSSCMYQSPRRNFGTSVPSLSRPAATANVLTQSRFEERALLGLFDTRLLVNRDAQCSLPAACTASRSTHRNGHLIYSNRVLHASHGICQQFLPLTYSHEITTR